MKMIELLPLKVYPVTLMGNAVSTSSAGPDQTSPDDKIDFVLQ